ncbi:hypothetical protein CK203_027216 [Vitis vinifera]|uniref:Uncharacterized protein n=1 Tax=Vitis vinifera TaxID=29760 RepID=A0A438I6B4_VITVI|nr:hypothetical protein CK203_027216 [Vitis vinifera]
MDGGRENWDRKRSLLRHPGPNPSSTHLPHQRISIAVPLIIQILALMDSSLKSPPRDKADAKTAFRKPTNDATNRKYRRALQLVDHLHLVDDKS